MKQTIFSLLLLSAIITSLSAQTATLQPQQPLSDSPVLLQGEKYLVGDSLMDKKAFQGFLQSQDAVAYNYYCKARKMANTGWALLGTGLGVMAVGVPVLAVNLGGIVEAGAQQNDNPSSTGYAGLNTSSYPEASRDDALGFLAGFALTSAGSCLTTASIPCLAVGYTMMHRTAGLYNQNLKNRNQPVALFSIQSSSNGIGIAITF